MLNTFLIHQFPDVFTCDHLSFSWTQNKEAIFSDQVNRRFFVAVLIVDEALPKYLRDYPACGTSFFFCKSFCRQ